MLEGRFPFLTNMFRDYILLLQCFGDMMGMREHPRDGDVRMKLGKMEKIETDTDEAQTEESDPPKRQTGGSPGTRSCPGRSTNGGVGANGCHGEGDGTVSRIMLAGQDKTRY